METIYAAMLLHKTGHKVDEHSVRKVLDAAGAHVDETKIKALVSALEGVDIDATIKEATSMQTTSHAPAIQEHKEEKKKEEKADESVAAAGLSSLFG